MSTAAERRLVGEQTRVVRYRPYVEEDEEEEGAHAPLEGEPRQATQHGPRLTAGIIPPAPPTRRDDIVDVVHGVAVPDPYRWLEADDDPEVTAWVAAQNERTREALDALADRPVWHERLLALAALASSTGARIAGSRLFTLERAAGQEQYVLTVRAASGDASADDAEPRVLVDPAGLAADAAVALDWFHPSPDGRLVAYGLSEGGDERSSLRVLDVDTGADLAELIPDTRYSSVAWRPHGGSFRYTRYPAGEVYEPKVYEHRLGTDWHDDLLVWGDLPAREAMVGVSSSRDGRWTAVVAMVGWSRGDLHLLDESTGAWRAIHVGLDVLTRVRFDGDRLVAVTTLDAPMGRVVAIDPAAPTPERWTTLVPEGPQVIEGVAPLRDSLLVWGTRDASAFVEHRDRGGALIAVVALPEPMSIVGADDGDELDVGDDEVLALQLTSFTRPPALYRWSPGNPVEAWTAGAATPSNPVGGATFDPDAFTVTRTSYRSTDGTEIGLFLLHRRDVTPSATTPALLYGYGGFSISMTPGFRPTFAAWLERGGLLAVANLRGGYEHGEAWHRAGMRDQKQHVFDDFAAAADHLVAEGLTSRDKLMIYGGSNGGLLVGAAMTQRPDLCRAVVCAVPLLDMIRFPRFLIARLWTNEYGDPDIAEEFAWLLAYSPYHHVVDATSYPSTLFLTAEGDSRVHPSHALKMTARLQAAAADQAARPVLLRVEGRAGHGVGKPASKQADEAADVLAFCAWQLGMNRARV